MKHTLPASETITGKGTTLAAAMAFVESRFGAEGVDRLKQSLKAENPTIAKGIVVPSARYPLGDLVGVYEAVDRLFGNGDLRLCFELGKFAADYEVKLIHKVFLKVGKIEYWFKLTGATWRSYYSAGKLVPAIKDRSGSLTLSEFNPVSKAFCARFAGWTHRIGELSNLTHVRVSHDECVLDGAPACVWNATWVH